MSWNGILASAGTCRGILEVNELDNCTLILFPHLFELDLELLDEILEVLNALNRLLVGLVLHDLGHLLPTRRAVLVLNHRDLGVVEVYSEFTLESIGYRRCGNITLTRSTRDVSIVDTVRKDQDVVA